MINNVLLLPNFRSQSLINKSLFLIIHPQKIDLNLYKKNYGNKKYGNISIIIIAV